jgi:hypothetical protein
MLPRMQLFFMLIVSLVVSLKTIAHVLQYNLVNGTTIIFHILLTIPLYDPA